MEKLDFLETWLNIVATSHSDSNSTREAYKSNFQLFCTFIGKTPKQIVEEYENSTDRQFKRRYAQYIRAFTSAQYEKGLAPCTIAARIAATRSFFKYNDLPLGHVPAAQPRVLYHNRDITHEEVKLILDASRPREKAFFAIMAQSGLRPSTICNLKYRHIKQDLINNRIPCKIEIPEEIAKGKYHSYFTFVGKEAVKYLRAYLHIRPDITDEDYLFLKQGTNQKTSPKSLTGLFARTVQKLRNKGLMEVEQKQKSKPRDIRLYNLRKWFRKHAHEAGFELVQFWMGHIVKAGQEEHYRPRDVEFHRKLYAEKAMPFLRLETATPTETEKTIAELREQLNARDKELDSLKEAVAKLKPLADFVNSFKAPEELRRFFDDVKYEFADSSDSKFRPLRIDFSQYISDKLDEVAKRKGITQAEALREMVKEDWEKLEESSKKWRKHHKAEGIPITREDYEKHLRANIKKLQRRLEKIQKSKD